MLIIVSNSELQLGEGTDGLRSGPFCWNWKFMYVEKKVAVQIGSYFNLHWRGPIYYFLSLHCAFHRLFILVQDGIW